MLVLSRKRSEQIRISENIVITIVRFDRNQVRIGIEAPGDVTIVREELLRHVGDDEDRLAQEAWRVSDVEAIAAVDLV